LTEDVVLAHSFHFNIPTGTEVDAAKRLMTESGLRLISCDDLDEAAMRSVQLSQIVQLARDAKIDVSFELPI
jgi:succinyl-CoA synthetase beta subunit